MLDFFEKTLEEIVFENRSIIHERGLPIFFKNSIRQMALSSGKRMDIFTWEINADMISARIIEFKREEFSESGYFQSVTYYMEVLMELVGHFKYANIEIVLIGTGFNNNVEAAINTSDAIIAYTYEYKFDGLFFRRYNSGTKYIKQFMVDHLDNKLSDKHNFIETITNESIP